tara:strand:+ start:291 stop:716 length:426 start_codon:yes stop_codon:yes gene_type:complete
MATRHYTYHANRYARNGKKKFDLPGHTMHLIIPGPRWPFEAEAAWVWWRPPFDGPRKDGYQGWTNCALFRNEGALLSSQLIREAVVMAEREWGNPIHGYDTYVWADKVLSTNPGYCYQKAGWVKGGWSQDGKKLRLFLEFT